MDPLALHGSTGLLALSGGDLWRHDGALDAVLEDLLERAGGELVLLPTAAAYEQPRRLVERASTHVAVHGGHVSVCPLLSRVDAGKRALADQLRGAALVVIADGSPLHLRSVLKDSTAFAALVAAWHGGAIVAAAGGAATAITDPMVDPRGGAFSVGLGLVRDMAVVVGDAATGLDSPGDRLARTLALAPAGCAVVAVGELGALVREPDGHWRGVDAASDPSRCSSQVFVDGVAADLTALAGKPVG